MTKEYLWLRMGSNAEYEKAGSVEDLVNSLTEFHITNEFTRVLPYGITDKNKFKEHNYISLYYGDKDAQPVRPISDEELINLNKRMRERS